MKMFSMTTHMDGSLVFLGVTLQEGRTVEKQAWLVYDGLLYYVFGYNAMSSQQAAIIALMSQFDVEPELYRFGLMGCQGALENCLPEIPDA